MQNEKKAILEKVANTIRGLSIDAVQKANSGHPGLPLGCAELGAFLYGAFMRFNPKNTQWLNRDRFILSAGHGSMLLYSCLHLAGFNLSLDDIKNFRQLHSKTPGHPEYRDTEGVETTTGPLGQGVANAAGQALGLKLLGSTFNTAKHTLFDAKVIVLAGDGCIMEGISSEASSLAGHLKLDNLILIYDSNKISLDGPLADSCSEDTAMRYRAYGWDVIEIDGYDFDAMEQAFDKLRKEQTKPTMILAHTIIGKGSPNKAGTNKAHGSPLGPDEVIKTKKALGIPEEEFYIPQAVIDYFQKKITQDAQLEDEWKKKFQEWKAENPELAEKFHAMEEKWLPEDLESKLDQLAIKTPIAGRSASNEVIQVLAAKLPQLYGGSADLSGSDLTMIKDSSIVTANSFKGRNIKYGVREFAMAAMAAGLSETQMITPYVGTFLTFSDYMRNAIRLASLSHIQVIYQFTHDSIYLGEDGPTHQPVEHYAALRAMPNLHFIRPADANEVKMAWLAALKYTGPTALSLTRQALPELPGTKVPYAKGMGRGGYIIKKEKSQPDYALFASGSEVSLAVDVATELEKRGKSVRVVSMPCWDLFEKQDEEYKQMVIGGNLGQRVSIEAGVDMGWHKYIGIDGIAICMTSFGASAPASALAEHFGFTVDAILQRIL